MNPFSCSRTTRGVLVALCFAWVVSPGEARAQAGVAAPSSAAAADSLAPTDNPTPRADSLAAEAEAGDPDAQFAYGMLFQTGTEGLHVDYSAAVDWFRRAAEQDHVEAMLSLSTLLLAVDPADAMDWVRRAAGLGSSEAQWRAGQVLSGRLPLPEVEPDREEAMDWYGRAADQRHSLAEEALADIYTEPDDSSRYADALELYRRAQEDGPSSWSVLRLGMMYAAGEGAEQDDAAAEQWLSRLGSDDAELDPQYFSNADLEVLGGLQSYYGLNFMGGRAEPDPAAAAEAFQLALESRGELIHPSFARTAEALLQRLPAEQP